MSLPRLTGAIRAFGPVSPENQTHQINKDDICFKRRQRARKQTQQGLEWQELARTIKTRVPKISTDEVTDKLRQLIHVAREMVGKETDPEYVEACSVMLFETFKYSELVTQTETARLRRIFGPFPASCATQACDVVKHICAMLPDDVVKELTSERADENESKLKAFGEGIKFKEPDRNQIAADYSWLDSDEDSGTTEFSMKYHQEFVDTASVVEPTRPTDKPTDKVDSSWLRNEVEKNFDPSASGMSVTDMCSTIFDILTSSKSDDQLQNDLFELLGFDRFEFIQSLIVNRRKVIDSALNSGVSDAQPKLSVAQLQEPTRPNYGCQVTIQTDEEKRMRKLMRREEKKMDRKRKGEVEEEDDVNPQVWREQREIALLNAQRQPILLKRDVELRERYPNVYDSLAQAKQSSSYVGGSKMLLPEGTEKKDYKMYEEVNIPPADPAPMQIGKTLVPISSLDEIGQMAFKGMKSLNRIQSMVFDTAYNTNENLLICAPTGAGKTNVAMLAVLHEVKQHISQGVIKKDEFKIIYVAPMKALAAEMVRNFGRRLEPLGISVKELTGDMQLTKAEIMKTQMLVTTPEKWDVVTRKSTGDVALTQIVKLLIIDEVHLLHDDRGAVIESLVARTLRQVESSQNMIRILGLSATLPNYLDVARFLNVNPHSGLFFFDGRFRPVPLAQTFIGVKSTNKMQQLQDFNTVAYEKVLHQVKRGQQTMVFVHARNETVRTAMALAENARNNGESSFFLAPQSSQYGEAEKQFLKSRNKQLRELFPDGFAIHHAGMLRQDRNLVERYFSEGLIKCLVCTATLAWGVNLPAHAVIIKGTQIYDAKRGAYVDLGILDVQQIFGRAGRPQYDTFGHGTIITAHDKLSHYLGLLTQQNPIESQFVQSMTDNLNAEVSLGTVTNLEEAVKWLSYTYLYVRMRCNPLAYGIPYKAVQEDSTLEEHRRQLISVAARGLDKSRMIRFDERTGYMSATDLGRTSSHYYIKYDTVEVVNEMFRSVMAEDKVLEMVSKSQEFQQIKVREEELQELDEHLDHTCVLPVAGGSENTYGKVNILLQTYISRERVECFSLVSDQAYVAQNAARIVRALFEIALRKGWPIMAGRLLQLSKVIEKRLWAFENPLRQFSILGVEVINKLEAKRLTLDKLREMDPNEIGHMVHHVRIGPKIKACVDQIPTLGLEASIQPITRTVLRVRLTIHCLFKWNDKVHGNGSEPFWVWVEDPENNHIYHSEYFLLHKKHALNKQEPQSLVFTIPIFEPLPSQYYVRAISDRWLGSETVEAMSFQHLILPEKHPPHTELLDLQPLPIAAFNDPKLEALYKYTHFNPIQTQIFHTLYHNDCNVLLGAPTGSGKTVAAEMAIFRVFREYPGAKCVYIAPLKALVRERMADWRVRIEQKLGKKVVELTGDVTPDMRAVGQADLIVTTPEKWDGISRSWQTRGYVKAVALLVIDEIHLLGNDRGPVLEVIVSRTNFISSHTTRKVRVVGLSTALANARDLADWLGIKEMGLFNFRPSVRPVPLEVHIAGFPGKHYCPRMATMNKPTFQAIRTHSPSKPVLVFVSSRRQTRLTALDLIAFLAAEDDPKQWLHMPELEMENIISGIRDTNLKLTLAFGIGLHHAGLHERDRKNSEELFVNSKIQVLIATSTLAWGVNFPAHLVVVKGTEFFDGKTRRYVDFPITDVLQMMGRAGRPQFDDQGKAVILVHDVKKHFYKKFLYEPFPVESNLLEVLPEHLNAEIVAGTIGSKQDAMDYLTWTYFFRRLVMNPSFYHLDEVEHDVINKFLSNLVEKALLELQSAYCLQVAEDNATIVACTMGRIASYYYLNHVTVRTFKDDLSPQSSVEELIQVLSHAHEYADLPVRHNEDHVNGELAKQLPLEVNQHTMDSSHTKTNLLLQAHFSRVPLPSTDYLTDTKSVLDQAIRILQAMLDVAADQGWLVTALNIVNVLQMVIQGRWLHDSTLLTLPNVQPHHLVCFQPQTDAVRKRNFPRLHGCIETLPELMHVVGGRYDVLNAFLDQELDRDQIGQAMHVLNGLPDIEVLLSIKGWWQGGKGKEEVRTVPPLLPGRKQDIDWIDVHADQEYVLNVNLSRLNKLRKKDSHAYAPHFPKSKDEGWFLVVGDVEQKEVIALKRVGYVRGRSSIQIAFYTPESVGRVIYTLYVMSDSYLGLDQQYDICLDVLPSSIEAQVNAELLAELGDLDF